MRISDWSSDVCSSDLLASRDASAYDAQLAKRIAWGASPRGSIALERCARARAWLAGRDFVTPDDVRAIARSEEHTSELQSLMRISYAVFCLKKKTKNTNRNLRIKQNYNDRHSILTQPHS